MNFIKHIPDELQQWALSLSEEDIASILTKVGYASASLSLTAKNEEKVLEIASANIGLAGEKEVQEILQERYRLLNTAKSGKCGDFVITVNGIRILVEVKKYSKTVPGVEIDKFYRDIDSNASIGGALMISLTSRIVGITKSIEYTHQYVNGNKVPVVFLSLKSIPGQVAKECVCSAVDMLLCEVDSKNKCINIDDNIVNAVNSIDQNLDYLSQCRLMIHETQSMFNKQLGKLMQQVLSAEINIKNSVDILKTKVDIVHTDDKDNSEAIKDIITLFDLSPSDYNMLSSVMEHMGNTVTTTKNVIRNKDKTIAIKITKSTIKMSITCKLEDTLNIKEQWSYNGKILTILLTEQTLQTILSLIH